MALLDYSITGEAQSPCLELIVNGRFEAIPVFSERSQSSTRLKDQMGNLLPATCG